MRTISSETRIRTSCKFSVMPKRLHITQWTFSCKECTSTTLDYTGRWESGACRNGQRNDVCLHHPLSYSAAVRQEDSKRRKGKCFEKTNSQGTFVKHSIKHTLHTDRCACEWVDSSRRHNPRGPDYWGE